MDSNVKRLIHPVYGPGTVLDYFSAGAAMVRFDKMTEYGISLIVAPGGCIDCTPMELTEVAADSGLGTFY